MQRLAVFCFALVLCLLALAGCGGGGKKAAVSTPTTLTITPASLSIESGKFATLAATIKDQNGNTLTGQTVTWSTSNSGVADVTPSTAAVCGGKWNSTTTPTVCNPGTLGAADITATSGTLTAKITVTVFPHVARVEVAPMTDVCVSQTKTIQFTAQAFDAAGAVIPSVTNSSFSWTIDNASIATIDANGLVTGVRPGLAHVNAVLTNAFGIPVNVVTCPPQSIVLGTQGVTPLQTAFTVNSGQTQVIAATVTDIKGNPITDLDLTFSSTHSGTAPVTRSATLAANVL